MGVEDDVVVEISVVIVAISVVPEPIDVEVIVVTEADVVLGAP